MKLLQHWQICISFWFLISWNQVTCHEIIYDIRWWDSFILWGSMTEYTIDALFESQLVCAAVLPPFFGIWTIFLPPKFDHIYHFIQILLGPISKPPFSACRRSFCPPKLTKSVILFRSYWVPFWTSSGAPLLIFTRSAPPTGPFCIWDQSSHWKFEMHFLEFDTYSVFSLHEKNIYPLSQNLSFKLWFIYILRKTVISM